MTSKFDFIIVGGGTTGILLATRLADSSKAPSVLVVEAGPEHVGTSHRSIYDKFQAYYRPDMDHGYTTFPQEQLKGQQIPYLRGKGLGGSSNTNFMGYLYGSRDDFNAWADLVENDTWSWENVKETFKKIETFHDSAKPEYENYAKGNYEDHGHEGPIDVSIPPDWETGTTSILDLFELFGFPKNLDLNSGNPIGMGICPSTFYKGHRVTSDSAFLTRQRNNLTIWTNSKVHKILFDYKTARGVLLGDGKTAFAEKEVILAAGAVDSPKLLLLSGIGPPATLQTHGIDTIHALPGVGSNFRDHCGILISTTVASGFGMFERHAFQANPEAQALARDVWNKDGTGPLALHHNTFGMGFFKLPLLYGTPEFQNLDSTKQEFLMKDCVPHYEIVTHGPVAPPGFQIAKGTSHESYFVFLMNPQSTGSVSISSSRPDAQPVIDPRYLSHPYDVRALTESTRELMRFIESPVMAKYFIEYAHGPDSSSDGDILEFVKSNLTPVFHANGTVKMGKEDDSNACVDSRFRVFGTTALRVVDLSVCPLMPSNHTQSTAYLLGQIAAERIIKDYALNI